MMQFHKIIENKAINERNLTNIPHKRLLTCTLRGSGARDIVGHVCAHALCYHRSYTSKTGQGSVWNWVKATGHVMQDRDGRKE